MGHVYAIVDNISVTHNFSIEVPVTSTAHNVSIKTVCNDSSILDIFVDLLSMESPRDIKNNSFKNCNPSERLGGGDDDGNDSVVLAVDPNEVIE